jgi:hypothetical protein
MIFFILLIIKYALFFVNILLLIIFKYYYSKPSIRAASLVRLYPPPKNLDLGCAQPYLSTF